MFLILITICCKYVQFFFFLPASYAWRKLLKNKVPLKLFYYYHFFQNEFWTATVSVSGSSPLKLAQQSPPCLQGEQNQYDSSHSSFRKYPEHPLCPRHISNNKLSSQPSLHMGFILTSLWGTEYWYCFIFRTRVRVRT